MKYLSILFLGFIGPVMAVNPSQDDVVLRIQKHTVQFPEEIKSLAGGYLPAVGSGLQFKERTPSNHLLFYSITDRGPNKPIKEIKAASDRHDKVVLFHPVYSPFIVIIEVNPGVSAKAIRYITIKKDGKAITGFSPAHDPQHPKELLFTDKLEEIKKDGFGLDTESLTTDSHGDFWIGDEYGPSLNHVSHKTGNIIKTYSPGNGLPDIYKYRQENKGFEAIAVTPNGKIYAFLEGTININKETKDSAQFIRLLELDPKTGTTRMLAYPWNKETYSTPSQMKISDMSAVNNSQFIIVEQGPRKETAQDTNIIYKIDIKDATDISSLKLPNGKDFEYGTENDLKHIKMISRSFLVDMRKQGWPHKKLEGLTVIDSKTIAISNDSDFGIKDVKMNEDCKTKNCKKVLPVMDKDETDIWIIHLKNNL